MKDFKYNILILFTLLISSNSLFSYPQAGVESKEWALGEVKSNELIEKEFVIKNNGEDILKIEKIHITCDCLTSKMIQQEAKKDEFVKFAIILDLRKVSAGKILKYVYVRLNDPKLSTCRITITGNKIGQNASKKQSKNSKAIYLNKIPTTDGGTYNKKEIIVFYSSTCKKCSLIKDKLSALIKNKGNYILNAYDYNNEENYYLLLKYEEEYEIKENYKIIAFVQDKYFCDNKVLNNLPSYIKSYENKEVVHFTKDFTTDKEGLVRRKLESLGLPVIMLAGLIDGINPCAFVTIVFLVSFLAVSNKNKIYLLKTGVFYSLGVFVMYILLGAGLLRGIGYLSQNMKFVSALVYYVGGIFAIIIGFINLIDGIVYYYKEDTSKVIIKMPQRFHFYIHKVINNYCGNRYFLLSVFAAGIIVALLESVCTGQTYIPSIILIRKLDACLKWKSFILLLLYNVMFIIPMLTVIILAVFGLNNKWLKEYSKKNIIISKLLMFVLLVFIGVALLLLN